ncbi:MAG: tRNA uridine-5-carboxymethylaminomethyl(34) synthesis GTPase MnmE [Geminicoccaceae bacterium]|nr:tRNA uridine-5-carboxymethylaminomethyl(34) synthesis GTPase MnmE [Geminicoccaceae bacterium]
MAVNVDANGRNRVGVAARGPETQKELVFERSETIFAPATAYGRGAIAIIRISGPDAGSVCRVLSGKGPPPARLATVRMLREPETGNVLDQAMLLFFTGPASFTGEDMLEIHHHGGVGVGQALLSALAQSSLCRMADPGELTKRAYLNGKVDLTRAEAIADLIDATTIDQVHQATSQISGELADRSKTWRQEILHMLAMVEAEIDFSADDDVPERMWSGLRPDVDAIIKDLRSALDDSRAGERLRNGIAVAVIGRPNVGKSSLVNALARRDIAIVSPTPGTTRDVIEVHLDLNGLPVCLLDTAGLHDADDPVEAEGIRRALERSARADIRLLLDDDAHHLVTDDPNTILVLTKSDRSGVPAEMDRGIAISCVTGHGIDRLLEQVKLAARGLMPKDGVSLLTRERHRQCVRDAVDHLERAMSLDEALSLDMIGEDLRCAGRAIGRLAGNVHTEEILDEIFSSFCIGK